MARHRLPGGCRIPCCPWQWCTVTHMLLLLTLLLAVLPAAASPLAWMFSAKSAFYGFSYVVSFLRATERLFALLSPTNGVITVLRGGRNMHRKYYELKDDLQSATHHDPLQCLPLVLCAIHAEHDDLLSTTEAAFRKAFRPYFTEEQPIPDWAEQYVLAADIGTSVKSSESCQKAYPSCWYSARHLRELIAQAMEAEDTNLHLLRQ